ncbi:MAG: DMT family transporter [Lachnospiraceae bacterium]|nr:DMT family transporter [Lachnospiraceae bacterium]
MNKMILRQSMILFMAATVWGVAFVAQSVGMDYVGPYTFIAARNVIALAVLVPCAAVMDRSRRDRDAQQQTRQKEDKKALMIGGICCGICLFAASTLQQFGVKYTTVGKAGFITAMYLVLVPVFGIFLKKKTGLKVWTAVGLASLGLYLLCITEGDFQLQKGDLYMLGCAAVFAVHILVVDHFSPLVDGVKLSCIQTLTNAVLGAVMMLLLEQPRLSDVLAAWLPILYAGALSSGVGYTFQIIGQKGMNPTAASLILSLESVISVLAGWLLLHQVLTAREMAGCALAFAAIILVQLPARRK